MPNLNVGLALALGTTVDANAADSATIVSYLDPRSSSCTNCYYDGNNVFYCDGCKTNDTNESFYVSGVAVCAGSAGTSYSTTSDTLSYYHEASGNTYCWCKITSPAVTPWIFITSFRDQYCMRDCTSTCTSALGTIADMPETLGETLMANQNF